MNNEEWLKERRSEDERIIKSCGQNGYNFVSSLSEINEMELIYRQMRAFEIIAEEIIEVKKIL